MCANHEGFYYVIFNGLLTNPILSTDILFRSKKQQIYYVFYSVCSSNVGTEI
jgi:hypothetical protein